MSLAYFEYVPNKTHVPNCPHTFCIRTQENQILSASAYNRYESKQPKYRHIVQKYCHLVINPSHYKYFLSKYDDARQLTSESKQIEFNDRIHAEKYLHFIFL